MGSSRVIYWVAVFSRREKRDLAKMGRLDDLVHWRTVGEEEKR